jgi:hypothetical protein
MVHANCFVLVVCRLLAVTSAGDRRVEDHERGKRAFERRIVPKENAPIRPQTQADGPREPAPSVAKCNMCCILAEQKCNRRAEPAVPSSARLHCEDGSASTPSHSSPFQPLLDPAVFTALAAIFRLSAAFCLFPNRPHKQSRFSDPAPQASSERIELAMTGSPITLRATVVPITQPVFLRRL